jgi:superfamily II DNA helicase RecQ
MASFAFLTQWLLLSDSYTAFRPDYLKIARFAKEIEAERVLCLTATATSKVAEDIRKTFDIPEDGLFKTTSFRSNLRLRAQSFKTKQESCPELIKFFKSHPGPSIVYVTLQKHAEGLAEKIRKSGMKAKHFHAGMDPAAKSATQDEFMASKNLIIVATIAFGMGFVLQSNPNVLACVLISPPNRQSRYP